MLKSVSKIRRQMNIQWLRPPDKTLYYSHIIFITALQRSQNGAFSTHFRARETGP